MAVCAPVYKKAGVEYSPESKPAGLRFPQKKGKTGPDYLKKVLDCVSKKNRHKIFEFKKTACARWKIGPLEDTIYSEKPDVVNGWGEFYLPEIVSMQVVGVVEGISCPSDQLVLMTCEDGEVYAYDGEELHLVAPNLLMLRQKGIIYPGSKTYYKGEAFKDMNKEDREKVRNRPTGKRLEQEHLKLVTEEKDTFMEYQKATAAIKDVPYSKTFSAATMEFAPVDQIFSLQLISGGDYSPENKPAGLRFPQKKGKTGPDYLKKVLDCVSKKNRHKIFEFKKTAGATLKIGPLEDTIYSEEPKVVNGWGKFYLPEIVSMQVVGVVEGISCPWDQLVLMTCEDGKLFAYDGEELHFVASSMKQLRQKGIIYPGSKTYYKGEAFKDMNKEDWEEVWKSPTGKRLEQEHLKLVTKNKDTFMEYLKATAAIKDSHTKMFSPGTMEDFPVNKRAGVEYSPESKPAGLLSAQKNGKTGPDYLKGVLDYVSKEDRHKIFTLKKTAGATLKIGPLEDTIYSEEPKVVNGWGKFYLPKKVRMQVVGVVEGTSCPWDQLVLMTCEDGKLFAYDGEELHLVASSLEKLLEEGISYPAHKRYYEGEAFKDMTKVDWEKVQNSPTGRKLDQEHLKLVTENKAKFMGYLKVTECPSQKPVASPRVLVSR